MEAMNLSLALYRLGQIAPALGYNLAARRPELEMSVMSELSRRG